MEISEVTYLIFFGSITFIVFVLFIILVMYRFYKRNNEYQHKLTLLEFQKNQEILQAQLEVQEQTFQLISSELHDNLGQIASIIKLNLHSINSVENLSDKEKIEDTISLVQQLIIDIRSLSVNLSSDRLSQSGLLPTLRSEVQRLSNTGRFTAMFIEENEIPAISDDKAIILYRMSQEILNNIVKHSNATEIRVAVAANSNAIRFDFIDNGKGFDVNDKMKSGGGAGLNNLKRRAGLINATLTMESRIDYGTAVVIELPCI